MRFKKIASYVKRNPGLVVLLILLFFLNIASLKPQFYLIGWDNFSSYFNLKTNLFRTFFSSWREYRGLGVPSDSEVVDLFRQVFFLIFSPFLKTNLLDQVYFLFCLNIGVLGVYFFTKRFLKHALIKEKYKYLDIAAFTASFFYLFNLNTLATFYFPMTMYISRFASLPILFLIFFKLINEKTVSFKAWTLIILAMLFISTSYLTATIFIVLSLFILIFSLFLGKRKREILVWLLFICLNAFWLLPFANYALEKAEIVKLSPNFIDANESQLNKSTSFYSLERLLVLYPNFMDTKITDIADNNSHYLHPRTDFFNSIVGKSILFIFSLSYFGGVVLILTKYRKKIFLWIPVTIFLSLFLIGKEYTPLGFAYSLIKKAVPYFDILFRFADTKFNIFIAFSGGIGAGLLSIYLLSACNRWGKMRRYLFKTGVFLVLALYIVIFSSYFNGSLIAPFIYNKIPSAYFEVAKTINEDNESFRVLHLPLNKTGYWKFYVWGMAGSSFLNFMLDKPLIDRAFEPASMENAYLHQAIIQLVENNQDIRDPQQLNQRSEEFYQLLRKVGIKYLVWDETVFASVYSRGINFWGKFNTQDTKKLLENLESLGPLEAKAEFQLNILDYLDLYPRRFPLSQKIADRLAKDPFYSIKLYEVKDFQPKIYFVEQTESIDPNLGNLLASNLVLQNQNYVQDEKKQTGAFFPFQRQDIPLTQNNNEISFKVENTFQNSDKYLIEFRKEDIKEMSHYIEVFAHNDDKSLIVSFYRLPYPIIQNQKKSEYLGQVRIPLVKIKSSLFEAESNLENYFSDWRILKFKEISALRLSVNGYVFPLPAKLGTEDELITTLVVSGDQIEAKLLAKYKSSEINLADFQLTENPNCFEDKIEDYDFELKKTDDKLILLSKNGSTCLVKTIGEDITNETSHLETRFEIEAKAKDLDNLYNQKLGKSAKPLLKKFILDHPKPNLLRVCIRGQHTDECFNKHQILSLRNKQTVMIPLEKPVEYIYEPLIIIATNNITYQEQEISVNSLVFDQFKTISEASLEIKPLSLSYDIALDNNQEVSLQIPKALSEKSFYFDEENDGFYLSNKPCFELPSSYRTFRLINSNWVSFFENCSNIFSIKNSFDSSRFYLWKINYHLFSGKYPKYLLEDGFRFYKNNYLSLNQGYPNVPSFKDFQKPEGLLTRFFRSSYLRKLEKKFKDINFQTAYTYIYPHPELDDREVKDYTLHQDSENEGIVSVSSFEILELPNSWQNLVIREKDKTRQYDLPQEIEYKQVLPSLWQVNYQSKSNNRPLLLVFNEAYDHQWKIYDNVFNFFLGKQKENTRHLKFNGYANAWEIGSHERQKMYIFYAPEMLSWLGWSLTLATMVCGFFAFRFWNLRSKR